MCGIFGYFSKHSIDLDKAKKALQLQTHRGPDNTDYVSSNKYFIGHNRLSIIDLTTRGNQPMVRVVITLSHLMEKYIIT